MVLLSVDIFCKVVDNFGDIGVAWRLSRQLAHEQGYTVRLWVDHLPSFARICSEATAQADSQIIAGIEVRHWLEPFAEVMPADIVIETFGCAIPENYVAAMAQMRRAPAWINLDYLSAETWVDSHHGLPSPHARFPLTKYFYFPGFSDKTGGLLREQNLLQRRDAFQADKNAQAALWKRLGLLSPKQNELRISLFCYENPALPDLLQAWAEGSQPITCLVPQGVAPASLAAFFPPDKNVSRCTRGQLSVQIIPFSDQQQYDELLWACDVNFVRGEDSFVRAQWAARPFIWHIYPQNENTHLVKLKAFVEVYASDMPADAAAAISDFWQGFNNGSGAGAAWPAFARALPAIQAHNRVWAAHLGARTDLATGLADFCRKLIK